MRETLPYALPLGSVGLIIFLLWWEHVMAPVPPPALLCLRLCHIGAEEYLEGRVRLYIWSAYWHGFRPQILLLDCGATAAAREIARRLGHIYSPIVAYRQENSLPGANQRRVSSRKQC